VPVWHWIVGLLEAACAFWVMDRATHHQRILPRFPERRQRPQTGYGYNYVPRRPIPLFGNGVDVRYVHDPALRRFLNREEGCWLNQLSYSVDIPTPGGVTKTVDPGGQISWTHWHSSSTWPDL
jgi:hypothetical protein